MLQVGVRRGRSVRIERYAESMKGVTEVGFAKERGKRDERRHRVPKVVSFDTKLDRP